MNAVTDSRRFLNSKPDAQRARRKQEIEAIHVNDGAFLKAKATFDSLLKRLDDGVAPFGMVVGGRSGAGKTHLITHLADNDQLTPFNDKHGMVRPLVRISAPAPCTLKALGIAIHVALTGETLPERLRKHDIWTRVRAQLYNQRVSLLMIDELNHVFDNATAEERQDIVSTLKSLLIGVEPVGENGSLLGALPPTIKPHAVGLVLSGLDYIGNVIACDLQLLRRCRFTTLAPTRLGTVHFGKFVQLIEDKLGFSVKPGLASDDMLLRLHKATGGYCGRAAALIKQASFRAIDQGADTLNREKHFAPEFESTYRIGAEKNPFLVFNPRDLGDLKELDPPRPTRLRGSHRKHPIED